MISVIITCYNLADYIAAAIESVLRQDILEELEVTVVDDCSVDGSVTVISKYPSVRYIRTKENCGVLLATVLGIESSRGDLLLFLDGDDVWHSSKVAEVARQFRNDQRVAMVTHDLYFIDWKGDPLGRPSRPAQVLTPLTECLRSEAIRNGILRHGDFVWLGSALSVSRSRADVDAFCAFARSLDYAKETYQDWPLAFWVALKQDRALAYVDRKLLAYRLHGANHSGDAGSVGKARRNLKRTLNTLRAMLELGTSLGAGTDILTSTRHKLTYSRYMLDLYEGRRFAAVTGLFKSMPHLLRGDSSIVRELVRFAAIQTVGPERFTAVLKRKRRKDSFGVS
jgi:glycosyltransferase involved in cell wall biosynthesis